MAKIINESKPTSLCGYTTPDLPLTPNEEENAANLIALDYLHKKDGGLYLSVPVLAYDCQAKLEAILKEAVSGLASRYLARVSEAGEKILFPAVRKDLIEEFVHFDMIGAFFPIGYLYAYGMKTSPTPLEIPRDYGKSSNAVCILYKK